MITSFLIILGLHLLMVDVISWAIMGLPHWTSKEVDSWLEKYGHDLESYGASLYSCSKTKGYISTPGLRVLSSYYIKGENGQCKSIIRFSPLHRKIKAIIDSKAKSFA